MSTETIKQEIVELVFESLHSQGFEIDVIDHIDLINDLAMDSLAFISLVVEIEAYFGIEIPDELLLIENFKCIDNITSIVSKELSKKLEGSKSAKNVKV